MIAMIEGGVWGGACESGGALCDIVVAAEGSTFAITPAKLGVPYDIEGTLSFMQSVSLPSYQGNAFYSAAHACRPRAPRGTHQ